MEDPPVTSQPKGRPTGAAAIRLHVALVVGLVICAVLFRFELHRALSGNSLSWAYVGEWPCFAGFGIYFWWFIMSGRQRKARRSAPPSVAPEFAQMAANWQQHQRDLEQRRLGAAAGEASDGPVGDPTA